MDTFLNFSMVQTFQCWLVLVISKFYLFIVVYSCAYVRMLSPLSVVYTGFCVWGGGVLFSLEK